MKKSIKKKLELIAPFLLTYLLLVLLLSIIWEKKNALHLMNKIHHGFYFILLPIWTIIFIVLCVLFILLIYKTILKKDTKKTKIFFWTNFYILVYILFTLGFVSSMFGPMAPAYTP